LICIRSSRHGSLGLNEELDELNSNAANPRGLGADALARLS